MVVLTLSQGEKHLITSDNQPYPADAKQENEKTSKARYSSDDRHFH